MRALLGFGFRAVVGRSFGDIFRNIALKNELLLVELNQQQHQELIAVIEEQPELELMIDLPTRQTRALKSMVAFPTDSFSKELREGLDIMGV